MIDPPELQPAISDYVLLCDDTNNNGPANYNTNTNHNYTIVQDDTNNIHKNKCYVNLQILIMIFRNLHK